MTLMRYSPKEGEMIEAPRYGRYVDEYTARPFFARLQALLRKCEWSAGRYLECPECGSTKLAGHKDGCELAKALEERL